MRRQRSSICRADFRIKDVAVPMRNGIRSSIRARSLSGRRSTAFAKMNREKVKKAQTGCQSGLLSQPVRFLTAYPLVKEGLIDPDTLIIDAKSGTSGAGRGAKLPNLFCEVNENMKAYGVARATDIHRRSRSSSAYAAGRPVVDQFYAASGADEPRNSGDRICHPDEKGGRKSSSTRRSRRFTISIMRRRSSSACFRRMRARRPNGSREAIMWILDFKIDRAHGQNRDDGSALTIWSRVRPDRQCRT